jgi:hypothetical protein
MPDHAEGARVSIGWLMEQLGRRPFRPTLFVTTPKMSRAGLLPAPMSGV